MTSTDRLAEMAAEIDRLRARVAELESHITITFGTLTPPTPDEPTRFTFNVPPSAPPHDQPQPPIGHAIKWPTHDER